MKNSIKYKQVVRVGLMSTGMLCSLAVQSADLNERFIEHQSSKAARQSIKAISQAWGITEKEYSAYLAIMNGKRGTWSPTADPVLALGVEAKSDEARRRYAELYVQQEFDRTERELAFQREVTAAWKRLFPGRKRIGNRDKPQFLGIPNRLALVVGQHCDECVAAMKKYITVVRKNGAIEALDIYLSDSAGSDDRLRGWVAESAVPTALIRSGRITINHGEAHSAIEKIPTAFERHASGQWVEVPL